MPTHRSKAALPLFEHARRHGALAPVAVREASAGEAHLSTGLVSLDRALGGGFAIGQLTAVAARPKAGGSSLLLGATLATIKASVRAAYLTDQLTAAQLRGRLVVLEARVNGFRFRAGFVAPEDEVALTAARERLPWGTVSLVAEKRIDLELIDEHVFEYRPRLVVCDLWPRLANRGSERRHAELADATRALAELARRRAVAVVLRLSLPVSEAPPELSDLPGQGALATLFDAVVLLHRDEVTMPKSDLSTPVGLAEAYVHKLAGAVLPEPAVVRLRFDGRYGGRSDF
jgi:replicative DNA helicase